MDTLKTALVTLGIVASSIVFVGVGEECLITHEQVYIGHEVACVLKTHENLKAAMYQELITAKVDKEGNSYDIEAANWSVFWKTLQTEAMKDGLTKDELQALIKGDKQTIAEFLKPNK